MSAWSYVLQTPLECNFYKFYVSDKSELGNLSLTTCYRFAEPGDIY